MSISSKFMAFIWSSFWYSKFYNMYHCFKQLVFCRMTFSCVTSSWAAQLIQLAMALRWYWNTFQEDELSNFGSFTMMTLVFAFLPPHSGFFCHQLHLNSWHVDSGSCVIASALSGHFCFSSCHQQLITELFMKILSLLFNHCHVGLQLPVIVSSDSPWPSFMALILIFRDLTNSDHKKCWSH